jgi:hypothetical protein
MNILCHQHNEQGAKSMISLKNRLPRVETAAISQHRKIIFQLRSDVWAERAIVLFSKKKVPA